MALMNECQALKKGNPMHVYRTTSTITTLNVSFFHFLLSLIAALLFSDYCFKWKKTIWLVFLITYFLQPQTFRETPSCYFFG